jgi:ESX secretion-associated protein EspG
MSLELSLAAFDVLWVDLRLGRVPFPLQVRSHGDTNDDRVRIRAAVYADLGRRGLARDKRPADTLVEDLRLLADPTTTVDLVALFDMADAEPVKALAATRGRHGILAVQGKLMLRLTRMRDIPTIGALVDLLPATRAGVGNSVTQPAAALRVDPDRERRAQPGGVLRKVAPAVTADAKLRAIAAVMEKPVRRAGQLGVTRTDDSGRRHRLPGIAWFDTDEGRYATTTTQGRDGEDWVTLWPADNARLAQRLGELAAIEIVGGHG